MNVIELLAIEFGRRVCADIGNESDMEDMLNANGDEPDNSGICHTHDYIDANQTMLDAFVAVLGREPNLDGPNRDADFDMMNAAWNKAKAEDFGYEPGYIARLADGGRRP